MSNPQLVQGTDAIRTWGVQLAMFSGMTVGVPIAATIRIENVPSPTNVSEDGATMGLLGLGLLGPGSDAAIAGIGRDGRTVRPELKLAADDTGQPVI